MTLQEMAQRERTAQAVRQACQDYVMATIDADRAQRDSDAYLEALREAEEAITVVSPHVGMYL